MNPTQELAVRLDSAYEGYGASPSEESKTILWQALVDYASLVLFLKQHVKDEDFIVEQASFILLNLNKFKGKSNFSTWVFRVVSNHSIRWSERRRRARQREVSLVEAYRLPERPQSPAMAILGTSLGRLPPKRRRLIKLLLGGLSQAEAASKLKMSQRTAAWLYKETIKQLRKMQENDRTNKEK